MKKLLIGLMTLVISLTLTNVASAVHVDGNGAYDGTDTWTIMLTDDNKLNLVNWDGTTQTQYTDVYSSAQVLGISQNAVLDGGEINFMVATGSLVAETVTYRVLSLNTSTVAVTTDTDITTTSTELPVSSFAIAKDLNGTDWVAGVVKTDGINVYQEKGGSLQVIAGTNEAIPNDVFDIATDGGGNLHAVYMESDDNIPANYDLTDSTIDLTTYTETTKNTMINDAGLNSYSQLRINKITNSDADLIAINNVNFDGVRIYDNGSGYTETTLMAFSGDNNNKIASIYDATNDVMVVVNTKDDNQTYIDTFNATTNASASSDLIFASEATIVRTMDVNAGNLSTFVITDNISYLAYGDVGVGSFTTISFEQQGDAIPELPGSALWKVLIAVLALGLVVGVAAYARKKKK